MGGDSGGDGFSTIAVGNIRELRVGSVSTDWDIGKPGLDQVTLTIQVWVMGTTWKI